MVAAGECLHVRDRGLTWETSPLCRLHPLAEAYVTPSAFHPRVRHIPGRDGLGERTPDSTRFTVKIAIATIASAEMISAMIHRRSRTLEFHRHLKQPRHGVDGDHHTYRRDHSFTRCSPLTSRSSRRTGVPMAAMVAHGPGHGDDHWHAILVQRREEHRHHLAPLLSTIAGSIW